MSEQKKVSNEDLLFEVLDSVVPAEANTVPLATVVDASAVPHQEKVVLVQSPFAAESARGLLSRGELEAEDHLALESVIGTRTEVPLLGIYVGGNEVAINMDILAAPSFLGSVIDLWKLEFADKLPTEAIAEVEKIQRWIEKIDQMKHSREPDDEWFEERN